MFKYKSYFFCAVGFLMSFIAQAFPLLQEEDSSRSVYFLDLSFETENPDSILYYLDLAIKYSHIENNPNTFVESLIEKAKYFKRNKKGDSSSYYYRLSLEQSRINEPSDRIKALVYEGFGNFMREQNQVVPALSYLDSAALLFLTLSDSISYADMIAMKGATHDNNGNSQKALEFYLQASQIYLDENDTSSYGGIINNVAIVYKRLGDLDGALKYYNKSVELLTVQGDTLGIAISKVNRGLLYRDLDMYDLALVDVNESLIVFDKVKMTYGSAIAHHNLAEIFLELRMLDSVLLHVDKSQKIALDQQYWLTVVGNNVILIKTLRDMGKPELSIKTALRAFNMSVKHGFLDKQAEIAQLLAMSYEELQNFQPALKYFKIYREVQDSLFNKESREQINKLRTEYDLGQKESEIAGLELINSYQSSVVEKEEKLKNGLIIGIGFALIFVLLYYILYRRQKRSAAKLANQKVLLTDLNKEKDDLMAMVAHDLRSPLNNIKGLLALITDSEGEERNRMIALANESTDVLRNRIHKILDVEAINVGRINLKIAEVNISELLSQLTRHITPEAEKKQIEFYSHSDKSMRCMALTIPLDSILQ